MTATTDFAELHDDLRAVARDLLTKSGHPGWRQLGAAGWPGLEVPEALDGAGATFAEVAVVLEEMGRAATASPFLGTAVLGVGALDLLAPNQGRDALLSRIAAGERIVTVVLTDGGADPFQNDEWAAGSALPFRVERVGEELVLNGRAGFVPDAPGADRLLVVARNPEGEPVVVVLHTDRPVPGLDVVDQPVLDATRRFGTVAADDVVVDPAAVWRFADDPEAAVERIHDRGTLAVAVDSLGLSEAMLAATVAYAKDRHQFGRPIGSFQAVKHACADMLVHVTVGRELIRAAVAAGKPDPVAVSRAKSYVTGTAVDVVGKALQLHGGIGYTWESGVHVYLKRAALNRSLFGSPTAHRRRLAAALASLAQT